MKLNLLIFSSFCFVFPITYAATVGTDNASATPYATWDNLDDGFITGAPAFGAWTLTGAASGGGTAGRFIGDSTTLAPTNTGGNINSAGPSAFGLFAHRNNTVGATALSQAFRNFDSNLSVGQVFSISLAVNFRNGDKGIDLRDSTDTTLFNLNIGSNGYNVNNTTFGNGPVGAAAYDSNTVFNISLTQTSLSGGSWSIVRSGGISESDSGNFTGVVNRLRVYNASTDNGSNENNLFVNNLSIVPEPSTFGLLALSTLGAMALLRRRRS